MPTRSPIKPKNLRTCVVWISGPSGERVHITKPSKTILLQHVRSREATDAFLQSMLDGLKRQVRE